jgi:hypothetical protein
MRNRAKCKKCQEVIESYHHYDWVTCKCGEISVDGGMNAYKASAKDWNNFIRVDDMDNEIMPKIVNKDSDVVAEEVKALDKPELIRMLEEMIRSYEKLPEKAMYEPITHSDFVSALMLLLSILRAD